jgi:hypothetical protein
MIGTSKENIISTRIENGIMKENNISTRIENGIMKENNISTRIENGDNSTISIIKWDVVFIASGCYIATGTLCYISVCFCIVILLLIFHLLDYACVRSKKMSQVQTKIISIPQETDIKEGQKVTNVLDYVFGQEYEIENPHKDLEWHILYEFNTDKNLKL